MVALEPSTGKILAMVSSPSYDPNLLATHDTDEQGKAWTQLRDDPDSPLTNRAIAETYPPGSTFKVITTAAALQSGITDDAQLTAAPQTQLPNSTATLENYGGTPCGNGPTASLREAFARSCNTAFVELGIRVGAEALRSTAQAFGFDSAPDPIPLEVAESTMGPMADSAAVGMSSMGQKDVAVTRCRTPWWPRPSPTPGWRCSPTWSTASGVRTWPTSPPPHRASSGGPSPRRSRLNWRI